MLFSLTMLFCIVVFDVEGKVLDTKNVVANENIPSTASVLDELTHWLRSENITESVDKREEVLSSFDSLNTAESVSGNILFDRTVEAMRQASSHVASYLNACDTLAWQELPLGKQLVLPQIPLQVYLGETGPAKILQGTLRFYLALRLVQARYYDEAATILAEMSPERSIDLPAVLLNRAIVFRHLSRTEEGLEAIKGFRVQLERGELVPRRYEELAKILEQDLKQSHNSDSPDKISRKMDDVRRRLGKGRTDDDTQQAEGDVMKSLEQLIDKIAQRAREAQGQSDQGDQGNTPAEDSRPLKQKAPGNVDRRDFNLDGNWGDLPPKEREEALLKIEKEFPAHYRDIIEQYFREMAGEQSGLSTHPRISP